MRTDVIEPGLEGPARVRDVMRGEMGVKWSFFHQCWKKRKQIAVHVSRQMTL